MTFLIDTHCHLHDREFFTKDQANNFLNEAEKNNIKEIVCIGTDIQDSIEAKNFSDSHENVFWTFGIHPENASQKNEYNFKKIKNDKLVAIGEVGLDYHQETFQKESQIKLFEEMLQIAKDENLPVSFHIREAFDDFFAVLKNFPNLRGVVHSFTDSKKNLKKILETTDFYIGVNGLATYSTLPMPPLERILLETDAPFLTPAPKRGIINQPAYIKYIAEWLSNKTGLSVEQIAEQTTKNGRNLFNI